MIYKARDRVNGNHWKMCDLYNANPQKELFHEKTLLECKMKAEDILDKKKEDKE